MARIVTSEQAIIIDDTLYPKNSRQFIKQSDSIRLLCIYKNEFIDIPVKGSTIDGVEVNNVNELFDYFLNNGFGGVISNNDLNIMRTKIYNLSIEEMKRLPNLYINLLDVPNNGKKLFVKEVKIGLLGGEENYDYQGNPINSLITVQRGNNMYLTSYDKLIELEKDRYLTLASELNGDENLFLTFMYTAEENKESIVGDKRYQLLIEYFLY